MTTGYVARPWRSRFLRAPKAAIGLAERPDFVPLGSLARVMLGLKTGADSFFYLQVAERLPSGIAFGEGGSRHQVAVRGYKGWEGRLSARDVLPVARNPHELIRDGRRSLSIPVRTAAVYLYPRARNPDGDLAEYVRAAVNDGVHQTPLVRDNGDPRYWFRQVRSLVRPEWALPYNSAYDYGAFANPGRAVINGRFVGVKPLDGVPADLLGAVLSTTFVAATRLLEGVSTGSEGAYDLGPPGARLMRVPDVRRFSAAGAQEVREAFDVLRAADIMAPLPDRDGRASAERRRLDLAVLAALGLPAGEANTVVGRTYESYARWRTAVEDVEALTRINRRAAGRAGTQRGESPIHTAARRVWESILPGVQLLPRDLLRDDDSFEEVNVGRDVRFPEQTPLFDPGLIEAKDGQRVDLGSWDRVLYLRLLISVGYQPPYPVISNPARAAAIVSAFEAQRDDLVRDASHAAQGFVSARDVEQVTLATERLWYRACRAAGDRLPQAR